MGSGRESTVAKVMRNKKVAAFMYVAIIAIGRLQFTCLERVHWTV